MLNSVILSIMAHLADEYRRKSLKEVNRLPRELRSDLEAELYFFILQKQIEWTKNAMGEDSAFMHGKLMAHFEECEDANCQCGRILFKHDRAHKHEQIRLQLGEGREGSEIESARDEEGGPSLSAQKSLRAARNERKATRIKFDSKVYNSRISQVEKGDNEEGNSADILASSSSPERETLSATRRGLGASIVLKKSMTKMTKLELEALEEKRAILENNEYLPFSLPKLKKVLYKFYLIQLA
jgi:hypothetical protein